MKLSRLVPLLSLGLFGCNFDREVRDCIQEEVCVEESLRITFLSSGNAQPLGSSLLPARFLELSWTHLPGTLYQVQTSLCPQGPLSGCVFSDVGTPGSQPSIVLPDPVANGLPYVGRYVYRVRACEPNGRQACGPWSQLRYFRAGDPAGPFPGDMTGDGRAEVVVGEPTAGTLDEGAVHLYSWNGTGFDAAALDISSLSANAQIGSTLAHVGDVNADGYGDLVVGGAVGTTAYQVLGGFPPWPQSLNPQGAGFPGSVAAGGDFNADGYADALISKLDGSNTRIFVYLGGTEGLEADPAFTLVPPTTGLFGKAMTALDLNLDGFSDVIAGSAAGTGEVYVFFGRATEGQVAPDLTWSDPTQDLDFGRGVVGAGDLNADGYPDAVIYASNVVFHVVYGGVPQAAPISVTNGSPIVGVAGGLLDGDVFSDLLVLSQSLSDFYSGGPTSLQNPPGVEDQLNVTTQKVALPGDVDGDGGEDVALGVTVNSDPRVQVWFSPDQRLETITPPGSATSTFGQSLGSIR